MRYSQSGILKDTRPWGKFFVAGAAAVTLATALFASAFAATSVVIPADIASSDTGGWYKYGEANGNATIVNTGYGDMLRLDTTSPGSYVRVRNNDLNLNLSALNTLTYQTKQVSFAPGSGQVSSATLRLFIDTNYDSVFDDALVYEPYYQTQVVDNTLQTWDAKAGKWWSGTGDYYGLLGGPGAGAYATNFTLANVLTAYPNAKIVGVNLGGDNNSGTTLKVDTDKLTVNDTVYDFQLTKPQVLSAQDCKAGGFNNVATKEGKTFKNQGACVSYVNASDKASFKRNDQ